MDKDTGGPAFPTTEFNHAGQIIPGSDGMTMRDYFAAKVMQSGMVNATRLPDMPEEILQLFCKQCYRVADAMLKARNQ